MSSSKRSQDFPFQGQQSHYHPPTSTTTHSNESDSPQEKKHKGDAPHQGEQQQQQYYRPPSKNPFFGVIDNVSSFNGILEGPYDFGFALSITIDRITYKGVVFRNDNKNPMFGEDAAQMAQTISSTHAMPINSNNNNNNNNNNPQVWTQQPKSSSQNSNYSQHNSNNSNDEDSEEELDEENDGGSPIMSRNSFQGQNANHTPAPPSIHFPTVVLSTSTSVNKPDSENTLLPQQPQLQRQRQRQKKRQEKKLLEIPNYTRDGSVAGNLDPTKIADESLVSMGIQALNRISGNNRTQPSNNNNGGSESNSESGSV